MMRRTVFVLVMALVLMLTGATFSFAQDVPPTDGGAVDLINLIYERADLIAVVVGLVILVVALRPVLMELARRASENIPPGAIRDMINGVIPVVHEQLDARLKMIEDAARADNRTTLDETVLAEFRDMLREMRDALVVVQAAKNTLTPPSTGAG